MNTQNSADSAAFRQRELNKLAVIYVLVWAGILGWFVWASL